MQLPLWNPARSLATTALLALALVACGGGGGGGSALTPTSPTAPAPQRLIGEILSSSAQLQTSPFAATAAYSGSVGVSRAAQAAGQKNVLDWLFLVAKTPATDTAAATMRLGDDARTRLAQYVADNADLLVSGVRVLVADEIFLHQQATPDTAAQLQPQLDALAQAIALVRQAAPQARVGITVSPYATFGKPATLEYIKKAVALVDWVATDPYWFGDPAQIDALHDWSASFVDLARAAHPGVETWYTVQAFKMPAWDSDAFRRYLTLTLADAERYDHLMFFGWQFVSELDMASAGMHFDATTRALYARFFRPGQ